MLPLWASSVITSYSIHYTKLYEDIKRSNDPKVAEFYRAAPGGIRTTQAFTHSKRFDTLDDDRATGAVRDIAHAFSKDGGLVV